MFTTRLRSISKAFLSFAFLLSVTSAAQALEIRTWVAELGTDTGTCPKTAPCATWNYAMTQTVAGGEVIALDSGGFSPALITKSISLIGDHGVFAGISPIVLDGVTVAAGATDRVILRGLNIEGKGNPGIDGIEATNFGSLYIENCNINAAGTGIKIIPSTAGTRFVSIKNTTVRNMAAGGLELTGTGIAGSGVTLRVLIDGSYIEKNVGRGIVPSRAVVTLRDSVVNGNSLDGVYTDFADAEINVVNSDISHNGGNGIQMTTFSGPGLPGQRARLTNSSITNNGGCGVLPHPRSRRRSRFKTT